MTVTIERLATGVVVKVTDRGFGFVKDLDTSREYFFHFHGRGKVLTSWGQQFPLVMHHVDTRHKSLPEVGQILRFKPDEIGRSPVLDHYGDETGDFVEKGPRAEIWVTWVEYLKVIESDRAHASLMRSYEVYPPRGNTLMEASLDAAVRH